MKWKGTKQQQQTTTNEGYHLIVKQIDESKYTWTVSFRGILLKKINKKSSFKETMPRAKRQAIRLMILHMLRKID